MEAEDETDVNWSELGRTVSLPNDDPSSQCLSFYFILLLLFFVESHWIMMLKTCPPHIADGSFQDKVEFLINRHRELVNSPQHK